MKVAIVSPLVGLSAFLTLIHHQVSAASCQCPVSPDEEALLCDAGCRFYIGGSVLDDEDCDDSLLCRECEPGRPEDSSDDATESCRAVVLNNYVASLVKLGQDTNITTPSAAVAAWLPIVEETFVTDAVYEIQTVGSFVGYQQQAEYLISTVPSGNFGGYFFSISTLTDLTMSSDNDDFLAEWTIQACLVQNQTICFDGAQTFQGFFAAGEDRIKYGTVTLDFSFVQGLSSNLETITPEMQCGLYGMFCVSAGFPVGYESAGLFDFDTCVASLNTKDAVYNGTTPLSDDTSLCRAIHIILALSDPFAHCPHVAEMSTVCI